MISNNYIMNPTKEYHHIQKNIFMLWNQGWDNFDKLIQSITVNVEPMHVLNYLLSSNI
jgi:hypothetical protein